MSRCADCVQPYYAKELITETCPYDCQAAGDGYITRRPEFHGRAFPALGNHPVGIAWSDNAEPARKGWICPKCDSAVSPDEKTCPHCKPKPKKENADGERTHITESD
jgi:hypothetical protein